MIETMQAFLDAVPFARSCGMRVVAADRDAQTLALEMPFADHLGNAETTRQFHGGAIANLIDTAATFAAALATGGTPATVDLRTDFVRPAVDTTITGEAVARRVGRNVTVVDVTVTTPDGTVVALGRGSFRTPAA